ncbi:IclR family transcriptional regulator [Halorhabdus amylolytica]|uniref:IclR family transcriptional regulator n=1 Tax=Halorhabdus amylolytica TaxID=2559573 RepID=UPI0010AAFE0B|nr:IclR family transcriptional regulator C-terminal domain-containing protein [Halorhabdus amylolytica]
MTEPNDTEVPVKSVGTAFRIIELLSEGGATGVTELSHELDRAKSTVHDHLRTLENLNYLRHSDDGTYQLSLKYLYIGGKALELSDEFQEVESKIAKLAELTGSTASASVLMDQTVFCASVHQSKDSQNTYLRRGLSLPLHCTAPGKALLATTDQDDLLDRVSFTEYTEKTITSYEGMEKKLHAIRQRNLALEKGEYVEDIVGVSSAIHERNEENGIAISVHDSQERLTGKRLQQDVQGQVQQTARQIESDILDF